ncbi:hypothetical protein U1Q18_029835 [Sarracenia purpurea var. burkii]
MRRRAIRQRLWKRRWFGRWSYSGEICEVLRNDRSKCDSDEELFPMKQFSLIRDCRSEESHHNRKNMKQLEGDMFQRTFSRKSQKKDWI